VEVIINTTIGQLGYASSYRRYKEDIHDMGDASDGLMQLRPVTFRYREAYEDGSKPLQHGLIAEEVAEVYPDVVARDANGQVESVKYQRLDPMLLNELQKQHATMKARRGRFALSKTGWPEWKRHSARARPRRHAASEGTCKTGE